LLNTALHRFFVAENKFVYFVHISDAFEHRLEQRLIPLLWFILYAILDA